MKRLLGIVSTIAVAAMMLGFAAPAHAAPTAPGAPTAVLATAGDTQALVSFSAPVDDGGSTVTSYTVAVSPADVSPVNGASSPIVVTGLTNGQSYTFTVTATNIVGPGTPSDASNAITPASAQTITFDNPGAQVFGTTPTLTATSDANGLTPTFTSSSTGVCTVTSGGTLTFVSAGTCTINADQAGDSTYLPAVTVTRSFTVNAVTPGAPSIGTATAGNTQASVSFSAPTSNGGSAITSYTVAVSPADVSPVNGISSPIVVTGLTNGQSYTFTVTATNIVGPGAPSAPSNSITPAATQTITFNSPGAQIFGTNPTLTATSDSGLTPTFTSSTTGVCTVTSGGTLTFVTTGTCTINADQAGDGSYLPAPTVTRSFAVDAPVPAAPPAPNTGGTTGVVAVDQQVTTSPDTKTPGMLTVTGTKVRPKSTTFTYAYDNTAPVTGFVVVNEDGTLACSSTVERSSCTVTDSKGSLFYAYAVNGAVEGPRTKVLAARVDGRSIRIADCARNGARIECFGTSTGYAQGAILKPSIRFPGQTGFSEGTARIRVDAAGDWQWSRKTGRRTAVRIHSDDSRVRSNTVIVEAR